MNGPAVILAAAVVWQAAACATTESPASLPVRCLEAIEAKASPTDSATGAKDETALDAKRRMYATYFKQVKKKVAKHWKPAVEYRKYDPVGTTCGKELLVTDLEVTVDPDGWLDRVAVHRSSGLGFLDEAAMDAFENAQPLGEAPCNLLKTTGLARFRFRFVFDARPSAAKPASSP